MSQRYSLTFRQQLHLHCRYQQQQEQIQTLQHMESDLFVLTAWFRADNKTLVIYRFTKYSYVPLATDKAIAIVLHFHATHREYLDLIRWTHCVFCVFISGVISGVVAASVSTVVCASVVLILFILCIWYDTIVASDLCYSSFQYLCLYTGDAPGSLITEDGECTTEFCK